jgi:hypothetical protein
VAENLADLGQGSAGAQHLGRQRVPEPVGAPPLQPGPVAGPAHDGADRLGRQLPVGPPHGHEHRPCLALRPAVRQPGGERLPGRGRQGKPLGAAALAHDRDLACPPADVAELQARGFRAAQPRRASSDRTA